MFKVIKADSVKWLKSQPDHSIKNVITGMPDLNEIKSTLKSKNPADQIEEYVKFFENVAGLIFQKVDPKGYCIFIQTDRKYNRQWLDKSFLLTKQAYAHGLRLLWHKIVLVRNVGKSDLFRPTYSHFLCYSIKGAPGAAFPDVLPVSGKLYSNGAPYEVAMKAAEFIAKQNKTTSGKSVVDPFVGRGTFGVAALEHGLDFLGIDIDPKQVEKTKNILGGHTIN